MLKTIVIVAFCTGIALYFNMHAPDAPIVMDAPPPPATPWTCTSDRNNDGICDLVVDPTRPPNSLLDGCTTDSECEAMYGDQY